MKKALVMVFPAKYYLEREKYRFHEINNLSSNAERYVSNGFSVVNVLYGPDETKTASELADIPAIKKGRSVFADTLGSFKQDKNPDQKFTKISKLVEVDDEDLVVIGGFHLGDCVNRTAMKIQARNPNVLIDPLVTNAVRDEDTDMRKEWGSTLDFSIYYHNKYEPEVFEQFNLASLSGRFGEDHIKRLVEKYNIISR